MSNKKSERITLRLSSKEIKVVSQIQNSGDFEDVSTTIRFCVNFTNTLLKIIPASIGESFLETEPQEDEEVEEEEKN